MRITRTRARGVADELGADLEGPPIEAAFNGVTIRERDGVLTFLATQEIESGEALNSRLLCEMSEFPVRPCGGQWGHFARVPPSWPTAIA